MTVSDPSHLFSSRAGVALEKMSLLELMCELDKRHWVKKDGAKNVRRLDPFDVVNQEPTTWYCKKGFLPCKEYLLALLSGNAMGLKKVYHLQCKAYYQCLAIKPDVVPHQVAQFYKAFLARRRRFGEPESEPASASSNQLEPDDALMVLSKKQGALLLLPKQLIELRQLESREVLVLVRSKFLTQVLSMSQTQMLFLAQKGQKGNKMMIYSMISWTLMATMNWLMNLKCSSSRSRVPEKKPGL